MRPSFSSFRTSRVFALSFAAGCLAAALAAPVSAQTQTDDPYGVGTPSKPTAAPDTGRPASTTPAPVTPTVMPSVPTADTIQAKVVVPDTAPKAPVPRTRITRETTVNPMDTRRGTYRNPKKALFMSLIVPGLGQAYIGQNKFNYIRAAAYFTADVTMGFLWYQYSVVKYDRKVNQYRAYADQHWNQATYESKITDVGDISTQVYFEQLNPNRISYCASVQDNTGAGTGLYSGCVDPYSDDQQSQQNNQSFVTSVQGAQGAAAGARRRAFPDPVTFYEMIGQDQEFVTGWEDASNAGVGSDTAWAGTSAYRDNYNTMRQTAKDYSRLQTWFLGGIVLNHIASAVDAAITARRHNRILYEDGGARWFDKINVDGGMAFEQGRPRTHMMAYLSF